MAQWISSGPKPPSRSSVERSVTHEGSELCQDVGHGGVGFVVLPRLGERTARRVDEPRCHDGEHVELLAGVGRQVRTGDEVMSEEGKRREM